MDKRGREQKVKQKSSWLYTIGKSGIIQSLLVHIFIILFLALSFTSIHKEHAVKLCVSFESDQSDLSIDPVVIEIPQPEIREIESEVVEYDQEYELKVDLADIIENEKPSVPVENISTEILNTTVFYTQESTEPLASTTVNEPLSGSSSTDKFNNFMTGKLDDRLAKYGANSGDVQVSISWDDYNDIDLWVEFQPFNFRNNKYLIGWTNRESINGGYLDIDMNVQPFTNEAVENIVWPKNSSPYGTYTVYAHYYHKWDKRNTTQVYLRVQNGDSVVYRKATVTFGNRPQKIYTFTRKPSK